MSITNGYCTLAELRAQVAITDAEDTTDDSVLEQRIEAVSRAIDYLTGRRFYTTASDETRYYTARHMTKFKCPDDIVSITTLTTDDDGDRVYETTWTTNDYDLLPFNAALDSKPYTEIEITPNGTYSFPTTRKGVKTVGKFGYATTPPSIASTCVLAAQRLFKRRDVPFGVLSVGSLGQIAHILERDPDVMLALSLFMRDIGPGVV